MNDPSEWIEPIVDAVERQLAARRVRHGATYRLQFSSERLTFGDATAIVPYLRDLGATHIYASPYLKSRPGSGHGYDIVDHGTLNPELGTEDDYAAFVGALRAAGMGQILDIVPNHMAVSTHANRWWADVLENGPSSPYAHYFDIDWHPVKAELRNKILLPVLGDQYGRVLEDGQLQLGYEDGAFHLHYYEMRLPLDPKTYSRVLRYRLEEFRAARGAEAEELFELESIITALDYLPESTETEPERVAERQREKEVIKGRLRRLTARFPAVADFIQENVRDFNGDPTNPHSFDRLDELLADQIYRLSHWKAASDEINYRRFFDINDLAAICMEEPDVFADAHRFIFELLVRGDVDGLRVDHIDGLFDPTEYLWRLQWGHLRALGRAACESLRRTGSAVLAPAAATAQASQDAPAGPAEDESSEPAESMPEWEALEPLFFEALRRRIDGPEPRQLFRRSKTLSVGHDEPAAAAPEALESSAGPAVEVTGAAEKQLPLFVVVEKILELEEQLPGQWPVAGTTGYDFLNLANGLFVDPAGVGEMVKIYNRFVNRRRQFSEVVYRSKRLILHVAMASELQMLAYRINRLSERHRRTRDFTLNDLRTALREILACFPVYRSYIDGEHISERDRHFIHLAVAKAKRRNPAIDAAVFNFTRDTLLLEQPPELGWRGRRERLFFVGRFQQVTSPVMAKGVEDTAFYRYYPLASLNEVGGAPARGTTSIDEFHRENQARLAQRPRSLIGTTTHDTKRSEDVRARINVLAEIPHYWRKAVSHWSRLNRRYRREVDGEPAPSRNDEYLFYQSLVGIWPLTPPDGPALRRLVERLQGYMEKATHEAKQRTSWINPNPDYDAAVRDFVASALADEPRNRFLADFRRFHKRVVNWGLYTALSQTLLKLTAPGIPDVYQGQELWNFSLVDPDNRRPVDFGHRRELLDQLRRETAEPDRLLELAHHLAHTPRDSRTKLLVTWRALQDRRERPELYQLGEYIPVETAGIQAQHVCAFVRRWAPPAATGGPSGKPRSVSEGRETPEEGPRRPEPASPGGPEQLSLIVVPRLVAQLTLWPNEDEPAPPPLGPDIWKDTRLTGEVLGRRRWTNLLTGQTCESNETLPLASVLADFPVALLSGGERFDEPG